MKGVRCIGDKLNNLGLDKSERDGKRVKSTYPSQLVKKDIANLSKDLPN